MMVFLAQFAEGGGCLPIPFHPMYAFHSIYVVHSTPSQARLARATCTLPYRPSSLLSGYNIDYITHAYCWLYERRYLAYPPPPPPPRSSTFSTFCIFHVVYVCMRHFEDRIFCCNKNTSQTFSNKQAPFLMRIHLANGPFQTFIPSSRIFIYVKNCR